MKPWQYRPARDLDLPPAARWKSTRREGSHFSLLLHGTTLTFATIWMRLAHRLRVEGEGALPTEPPFVLVANHGSHLDLFALIATLPWRWRTQVHAVSAGDTFFKNRAASWAAAHVLNALPLWRRGGAAHALQDLRERMATRQEILILFPEGTRCRDGRMGAFKPGLGRVIAGTAVPVIPCYLQGTFAAWPPGRRFPRPSPIQVRIGEPRSFATTRNDREGWRWVAETVRGEVERLEGTAQAAGADLQRNR